LFYQKTVKAPGKAKDTDWLSTWWFRLL